MAGYSINGIKNATMGNMPVIVIAASDSINSDKEKANIICTGTNDNAIIQSVIDSIGERSAIIQFANGHYYFDSFSVHDDYYYGLYFAKYQREIILRGCNHDHRANITTLESIEQCAIFEVTQTAYDALPANQESYFIGSNREYQFPYKVIGVEDISFYIPDYTKPIIGVDGAYCSDMHVEKCFFTSGGDYTSDVNVNPKCVAVRGCGQGNIGYNYYFQHIKILGWGTGFQITGEHLQCIDCIAQKTAYGFVFGNCDAVPYPRGDSTGLHPNTLINCGAEANSIGALYFGTGHKNAVSIIDMNMEAGLPSTDPWGSEFLFSADDNSSFCGEISYAVLQNFSPWIHIQKNAWDSNAHASKFKTIDLIAPLSGTTAQRPTDPVYLSQYFDTTLDKMLTWNGSAWV